MLLHRFQIRLQLVGSSIAAQQPAEAAELFHELRRAVGAAPLEIVDAIERIVVKARLPEARFEAIFIREGMFAELS